MTHSTVVEGDWNHSTGGEDEIEFEIEHHPHRQSPTQPNPSTTSDMTYQQEEKQENTPHQLSSHSHSHYLPPPSSSSALLPSSSHYGYSAEEAPTPATRPESTATTTAALSPPPTAHAHERPTYAYNRASFASSPVPTPTPPPAVAFTDVQAIDQAARAAIESQDDHIVSQFIQLLEKHREECERKHKYVDAEVAKNKIEQLRQHEESRRLSALSVRHIEDRLAMEEAHILEFDEFNQYWSEKVFKEFDRQTTEKQQVMLQRHVDELEEWTKAEQDRMLHKPKYSKQLLQLRSMQEAFARSRDYRQAERVRQQADALENFELTALKSKFATTIAAKRAKFMERQQAELSAYMNRRIEERKKLEQRKLHDLQSEIIQKYKNLHSELETAQSKERQQLEKLRDMGVSGSVILREQAPRHRANTRLPDDINARSTNGGDMTPRSAASALHHYTGRTRLFSTGLREGRRIADEEEAMMRAYDDASQSTSHRSESTTIPTIAGALASSPLSPTSASASASASVSALQSPISSRPHSQRAVNGLQTARSAHTTPVTNQQQQAYYTPRPATSHAYDPSGSRPLVRRPLKSVSSTQHYSRPFGRAGNSHDRAMELDAILNGTITDRSHRIPNTSAPIPSAPLSYVDRMARRQTNARKSSHSQSFLPPPSNAAQAQARAIEQHKQQLAEQRRQAAARNTRASRNTSDEDDF